MRFEQRVLMSALNCSQHNTKSAEKIIKSMYNSSGVIMTDDLDIDLMRTKPIEFATTDNLWLNTINLNSISSQRENMTKNNYYRLDITFGSIKFKLHP